MRFRENPSLLGYVVLCACLVLGYAGVAQTLTTNDEGERIIVYDDGTWRYFSDPPPAENAPQEAPTPIEDEAYTNPALVAEAEARARVIARKRAEAEVKRVRQLEKEVDRQKDRELAALRRVAKLRRADASLTRDELDVATRKLSLERQRLAELQREVQNARTMAIALQESVPMTSAQRREHLVAAAERVAATAPADAEPVRPEELLTEPETGGSGNTERRSRDAAPTGGFATYDLERDPRYHPPVPDCVFAYEGIDEFTKRRRRDLAPELLFAYTQDDLKQFLGSEALVTATGNLAQAGGYLFLELDIVIRSQFANREFGTLPKNTPITVRLIDGSTVVLRNQALSQGEYDGVDKVYRYRAVCGIGNATRKQLAKTPVDRVRVMWGTGFEDYPVYEIEFFQRQLRCL